MLFIFDMDEVLYRYDWRARMQELAVRVGMDFDGLRGLWWEIGREREAEAGGFRDAEHYLEEFCAAVGCDVSEEEWVAIRGAAMTPIEDSIAAAARAAELGTVTLLTNNGPLSHRNLATLAPLLAPIFGENLRATSFYGARKPDPVVFERVLEHYGERPEDAFFADDLEENVAAARRVGIHGHHFSEGSGLLEDIERFAAARSGSDAVSGRA